MKPARFKIPKGCESITFEQIGNTLVTTFDVESEFKIGDVCVDENDVDAVRNCFKDGGYLQKYIGGDEKGGTFIVGYKDRLFVIEDDLQVGENLNGIASIGCGSPYALGSMFTTMKLDKSAKERVTMALESASFYSLGVAKPFLILETQK